MPRKERKKNKKTHFIALVAGAASLSPRSPIFSLLTSCCFRVFSRGRRQRGAPGDNRLPSDEGRSVCLCGGGFVVTSSSPLPPSAPRGALSAAAAAFAGVLFAVAKIVDELRVGLGRGLLFPLSTCFCCCVLGGVRPTGVEVGVVFFVCLFRRRCSRSKRISLSLFQTLSPSHLALELLLLLVLLERRLLDLELEVHLGLFFSRREKERKEERQNDFFAIKRRDRMLPCFSLSPFSHAASSSLFFPLSLSLSYRIRAASERKEREGRDAGGSLRHAASGTREVAKRERERDEE